MPQLPGVRHRFVAAGDLKTHVALAGEGDPVVLLHDWPQHWYAWREVIPRLAEHHQVLALDLRGFGWTDIAWTSFEKESMADDVVRLLDAMEIDRVRLVGHGWGGWIAFLVALRHPERVEQLVTAGTPHPWPRLSPRNVIAARRLAGRFALALPYLAQGLLGRSQWYVRRVIRGGAVNRSNLAKEDFRIYWRRLNSSTRARAAMLLHRTFLLRELIPVVAGRYRKSRLATPTLMLHGKRDPLLSARLLAGHERYADDLRVELVSQAGHFLPEERPEAVADSILDFFRSAPRQAATTSG